MPIQSLNNSNTRPYTTPNKNFSPNFKSCSDVELPESKEKISKKTKIGVFLTTLTGVAIAMAITLKGKGYSLSPSKIMKTSPKKWGLFDAEYKKEKNEVEKLIGTLTIGSVGGGLIGGALFDKKENLKAKCRESIIQIVGNIATPLGFVCLGGRGFDKIEPKISKFIPQLKETCQHNIKINKIIRGIPGVVITGICLVAGIFTGNKVGNLINNKVFGIHDHRKIKPADMSPHIDDLCLALSLVAPDSQVGAIVTRIIPAALMIAGVSTGLTQEKPAILEQKKAKQSCQNSQVN